MDKILTESILGHQYYLFKEILLTDYVLSVKSVNISLINNLIASYIHTYVLVMCIAYHVNSKP